MESDAEHTCSLMVRWSCRIRPPCLPTLHQAENNHMFENWWSKPTYWARAVVIPSSGTITCETKKRCGRKLGTAMNPRQNRNQHESTLCRNSPWQGHGAEHDSEYLSLSRVAQLANDCMDAQAPMEVMCWKAARAHE